MFSCLSTTLITCTNNKSLVNPSSNLQKKITYGIAEWRFFNYPKRFEQRKKQSETWHNKYELSYLICMEDSYSKQKSTSLADSYKIGRHGPYYYSWFRKSTTKLSSFDVLVIHAHIPAIHSVEPLVLPWLLEVV